MKIELVFLPSPVIGHLKSTVQVAKQLVASDDRLSITIIIIPHPSGDNNAVESNHTSEERLRYITVSVPHQPSAYPQPLQVHIENQKQHVRDIVAKLVDSTQVDDTPQLAGFVVDMFCISMIDVSNEFGVASYMVYTSNATFLGITLHLQLMYDEKKYDVSKLEDTVNELKFPCLTLPSPVKCLPSFLTSNEWLPVFLHQARNFRKMKGILVNTVSELELHALNVFSNDGDLPRVYPIGPVLHLESDQTRNSDDEILRWLDEQPEKSVIFLCFGSMGGFTEEQTRELAVALEGCGHKFLWSLRRASPNILTELPGDFTNLEEVLPEGFLDRTSDRGKIIGWAPQVEVLAKPAIGGFVTHCGWNSMLESLWFGVPMVTWPLYAEQKINAFQMVEELGLAVEIQRYYKGDLLVGEMETVMSDDIERAIRRVMEVDSDVRIRVKEMETKCHAALMDCGSSKAALHKFVQDVMENVVA